MFKTFTNSSGRKYNRKSFYSKCALHHNEKHIKLYIPDKCNKEYFGRKKCSKDKQTRQF